MPPGRHPTAEAEAGCVVTSYAVPACARHPDQGGWLAWVKCLPTSRSASGVFCCFCTWHQSQRTPRLRLSGLSLQFGSPRSAPRRSPSAQLAGRVVFAAETAGTLGAAGIGRFFRKTSEFRARNPCGARFTCRHEKGGRAARMVPIRWGILSISESLLKRATDSIDGFGTWTSHLNGVARLPSQH